jgi:hypothetical protein
MIIGYSRTFPIIGGVVHDPNFSSVKLLLGFEGANGSTGAPGMTDESGAAHGTATVSGSGAISTTQFKFGASSLDYSGSGVITWADNADWHLGSGHFTVEAFMRPSSAFTFPNACPCDRD